MTASHDDRTFAGFAEVLELLAAGKPVGVVLASIVRMTEQAVPGMLGSILLLDEEGRHLRHGAAPSLPDSYNKAIDGETIGPAVGSCGTAAWRAERVVVEDIASDPLWADYRDLARNAGLRACWSQPILVPAEVAGAAPHVLGTFAMYYREPRAPGDQELRLIEAASHIVRLALQRHEERKTMEAASAALAERQQARNLETIGRLTGGVAHDFNNHLGIILGHAELLADRIGADDPQVAKILKAAERSAELIQKLLAFARRQSLRPEIVDLPDFLAGMKPRLAAALDDSIELDIRCEPGLRAVSADRTQLESALLNLATNARAALPEGGEVVIDCANAATEIQEADPSVGALVRISMRDGGAGMSEEVLERAVEPFFTTRKVGKATGLGLSMVHGFAEQSGGRLALTSREGQGTRVDLFLPAADEEAAASA